MKVNQLYVNVIAGVTISVLGSIVIMGIGWMAKMQSTVNKAGLALREIARNEKEMKRNAKVFHRRITSNHKDIEETTKLAIRADERSRLFWSLYLKERKP
jgi:hypothetical protein